MYRFTYHVEGIEKEETRCKNREREKKCNIEKL